MDRFTENFSRIRLRTVELCRNLHGEDTNLQAAVFVSPPKWHLAHTTWFFEQFILKQYVKTYREFDPKFGFLFNSYYNNIGERVARDSRGLITQPYFDEVLRYRAYVDQHILTLLENGSDSEITELITLGLNHEQQHQELLQTDIKYSLSFNPLLPALFDDVPEHRGEEGQQNWISVPEGIYEIGHTGEGFAFDNELGRHRVFLEAFELSPKLVTNGEFLEFIEAGGYEDFNLWLDEGWWWVQENQVQHPLYWKKTDDGWTHFTLGGPVNIDLSAPLSHVSYYEASAYAEWKGCRLPTETEWEVASPKLNYGLRWEWTNSAYLAYPGFQKAPGAVGEYNGKFMINQMVLRGSSIATPEGHSRHTYRNFFHPTGQWQFSGIRLAKK